MRLIEYNSLDEALADSRYVTMNHDGTVPITWMPDRLKILGIMGYKFASPLISYFSKYTENLNKIEMYPAEFIKAAHNFQMSLKQVEDRNDDEICELYLKMINLGIKKRIIISNSFTDMLKSQSIPIYPFCNTQEKRTLLLLSSLLRACSEILYFDNHTSCADLFHIQLDNSFIIKSYSNILSEFMYKSDKNRIPYKTINIFMRYSKLPVEFDMIGNYTTNVDINIFLNGYCIEIIDNDNTKQYASINSMHDLLFSLSNIIENYSKKYQTLEKNTAIELILQCLFQVNKPLFNAIYTPYNYSKDLLSEVILNYDNPSFVSTVDIFERMCYTDAVEIIIDPRKRIKGV